MALAAPASARWLSCTTAIFLISVAFPVTAEAVETYTEKSLRAQGVRITHHQSNGQINFIGSVTGKPLAFSGMGKGKSAGVAAMAAMQDYGKLFGLRDPATELRQQRLNIDKRTGRTSVRYHQTYNGIPVIGGELYVNLGPGDSLLSINGETSAKLALSTKPTLGAQQAVEIALTAVSKWHQVSSSELYVSTPILSIYDPQLLGPGRFPATLVWQMEISSTTQQPIREMVLVDAQQGHLALHFNQIDAARNRATYSAMETFALPGIPVCGESDTDCVAGVIFNNPNAVKAHLHTKDTYNFFSAKFGRDSIDDAGMALISTVNWYFNFDPSACPNAFWTGTQMVYCTGMVADDIVAHEIAHGINDHTSNLYNYYQSGAIAESLSDLWGEFVDLSNGRGSDHSLLRWLLAEDAIALNDAIRDMKDPTHYGDPDKMTSPNYRTSSADNGGVHHNNGVNNKAAYLMTDGDTFNGVTVNGIGIDKTAKIYYEAQTRMLTSGSDYLDLYNALYQSCINLVGTSGITINDCAQVRLATDAVEMNREPISDFNPDATACPANEAVSATLFSDDFESGFSQWSMSNLAMGIDWVGLNASVGIVYATSGVEALYGSTPMIPTDQRAEISVTLPNEPVYLYFKHATEFEYNAGKAYDAGVLEYSTDDGASWHDAAPLLEAGHVYNGRVESGILNVLAGKQAFVGNSHGFVSTRANLSSLAGQSVRLRWRVGTDSSSGGTGWIVDDVSVHTCAPASTFAFTNADYSSAENSGSASISVSRSGSSTGVVSVDFLIGGDTATAGSDFTLVSGTLTWADGDSSDKIITIPLIDDGMHEPDETVSLLLTNPSPGAQIGAQQTSTLILIDDDPAPTLTFSYPLFTVTEGEQFAYIYVSRGANNNGAISVDYRISAGSATVNEDYSDTAGSLSWDDGDGADKSFLIPLYDDTVYEGTETILLSLASPTGGAILGTQSEATLNITDDEPPPRSGGGGGALGWPFLLLGLLLLPLRRRFRLTA